MSYTRPTEREPADLVRTDRVMDRNRYVASGYPTSHRAAGKPADQVKRMFYSPIRGSRTPRGRSVTKTFRWKRNTYPSLLKGINFFAEWDSCASLNHGYNTKEYPNGFDGVQMPLSWTPGRKMTVDNCRFTKSPEKAKQQTKWGLRFWNAPEMEITDCDFELIPEEHGVYLNTFQSVTMRRCTAFGNGGKLFYVAGRLNGAGAYPPGNPRPRRGNYNSAFLLEDCVAIDCEQNAARGSHSFTFFNAGYPNAEGLGTSITMIRCHVVQAWPFSRTQHSNEKYRPGTPGDQLTRSAAALMVRSYRKDGPFVEGGSLSRYWGKVPSVEQFTMLDCCFHLTRSKQPMASINDVRGVHIEDCAFIGKDHLNPVIEIDRYAFKEGCFQSEEILLENILLEGGASIRVYVGEKDWILFRDTELLGRRVVIRRGEIISNEPVDNSDDALDYDEPTP